jgi:tRNA(Ile)-lysidine synthase
VTAPSFEQVHDWLDRHAVPGRPVAIGCSGGSDSLALLLIASEWARLRDRRLLVFSVDHGMRPQGRTEAEGVVRKARALGHAARILTWTGEKPRTGRQDAARQARHRLLADAARAGGAVDLLLAHTLDDQAETVWMRLAARGGWRGCGGMAPVSASPVWPEGRSVRLLRPLLDARRGRLRAFLEERGEQWVEDPSNADSAYTRTRIRDRLERLGGAGFDTGRLARLAGDIRAILDVERRAAARLAGRAVRFFDWGGVTLDVRELFVSVSVLRRSVIEAACLAVSGRETLPGSAALERIETALLAGTRCTGAGVMVSPWRGKTWMVRDPGAVTGRVDQPDVPVLRGKIGEAIWDGRFLVTGLGEGIEAGPLGRSYDGLDHRRMLDAVPGFARSGLMALRCANGVVAVAGLTAAAGGAAVTPLPLHRFCTRLLPGVPGV